MEIKTKEREHTDVHTYIKGASKGEFPATVRAPIITDGTTQEGVQALLDYAAAIEAHSNTEIAEKETERLDSYFSALSIYLTRALESSDIEGAEKEKLKGLIAPGQLKGLFNAMAAFTRNTLLTDAVIMPYSIHEGPASHIFEDSYVPPYSYDPPFSFGFLQIYEGGDKSTARSSTTIPVFTLDSGLLDAIAPHQPGELLSLFQKVVTVTGHDMLHHLHSPWVRGKIAHKFITDGRYDDNSPIVAWARSIPGGDRVEEWAQVTEGKICMDEGNAAVVRNVGKGLERYFNELERIAADLPKGQAHKVIDYFGTVMAQTLTRTFPLNHSLVLMCVERMQEMHTHTPHPLSEEKLFEAALLQYAKMSGSPGQPLPFDSLQGIRESEPGDIMYGIIRGYRQLGLDILPDNDNAATYKGLKLLQLAKLETREARSHVPAPVGPAEQLLRESSDKDLFKLLGTVAKVTGYRPAQQ